MVQKLIGRYRQLLTAIIVICLVLMVLMVFGNVVMRYAFNSGISVSEELSRWLFLWLIFLGASVAVHEQAHMGSDMELLKKGGMTVSEFAPAELAKLREKMLPVIAQFSANVGEETVKEVQAELAKMRK